MIKTMLLAMLGLAAGACAQPADEEGSGTLLEDEQLTSSPGGHDGGDGDCTDQGDFDIEEFAEEILPILTGEIDLNHPDGGSIVGCTRGPCHGNPRPDAFNLIASDPVEDNLEAFACFVDLGRPRRSQVLVCPSGDDRCVTFPHPGGEILGARDDLNYERILDYIRSSRS
jgi:hypothetical protein